MQKRYEVANDNAGLSGWDSTSVHLHFKASFNIASHWIL